MNQIITTLVTLAMKHTFALLIALLLVPRAAPNAAGAPAERKPACALPAFDNAIATIAATLRVDAGQEATHRWMAKAQGSVRLVGQLRKTTPEATAEIRVLTDGEPIWKQAFRAGDSIFHACDLRRPAVHSQCGWSENLPEQRQPSGECGDAYRLSQHFDRQLAVLTGLRSRHNPSKPDANWERHVQP